MPINDDETTVTLNPQELAIVLAGLRVLQEQPTQFWGPIRDILTDGGSIKPLSGSEIDALVEKVNLS